MNVLDTDGPVGPPLPGGSTSVLRRARLADGREVVLKELRPRFADSPDARRQLELEARVLGELDHPGLVRLAGVERAPADPEEGPGRVLRLALEYLPGPDLADELGGELAPLEALIETARELALGLAALHDAGWCHGDVKPENARRAADGRAVWIDLGFARRLVGEPGATRAHRGTPAYLAPEEIQGRPAGAAGDLYAFGLVLHELATGRHPFLSPVQLGRAEDTHPSEPTGDAARAEGAEPAPLPTRLADELLVQLADARIPPPSTRRPGLPPWLDWLILELLAVAPDDRPDAAAVASRLLLGAGHPDWLACRAAVRDGANPLPARARRGRSPFIGRRAELARLQEVLGASTAGGGAIFLEGPAGAGKSRLSELAANRARVLLDEPPIILSSRCYEQLDGQSGQPIHDLLLHWLGLERGAALGDRERTKLATLLSPSQLEVLVDGWNAPSDRALGMALTEVLARWLLALGERRPVIVRLDEIEWAGTFTLDVLTRLAPDLPRTRLVLILTPGGSGPTDEEGLRTLDRRLPGPGGRARAEHVRLEALDRADVDLLAKELFEARTPRYRLAQVLWTRSHGSPGLLAEVLAEMRRSDQVRELDSGELSLLIAPEEVPQPGSFARNIRRRVRELEGEDRDWLGRLAVLGGSLQVEFVHEVFPEVSESEIEARLGSLVQDDWLRRSRGHYRFKRPDARRAVYETLPADRRRALHRRAAAALREPSGTAAEMAREFLLAFHLRAAGEWHELLGALPRIVRSALLRGHPQRVHRLSRWGLEALDRIDDASAFAGERFELLEAAAEAADRLGSREEQRRWLDELSDYPLDPERDPLACGRVYLLHGRYAMNTGRYGVARGMLHNAFSLFEAAGADELAGSSLLHLGRVQCDVGFVVEARQLAERARERCAEPVSIAMIELLLALIELLEDRYERSLMHLEHARHALAGPRTVARNAALASHALLRSRVYRSLGRPRRALVAARRAVGLAREAGERRLEVIAQARLGGWLVTAGRLDEAQARLRDAVLMAEECEDQRGLALSTLWLGTLLCEEEDPHGPAELERARKIAQAAGLGRIEGMATALVARAALIAGHAALADEHSRRAVELVERFGAELPDRIVIGGTRALVLRSAGRTVAAERIEADLVRRVRRTGEAISSEVSRRRHRQASHSLFASVRTTEGPIHPRSDYPWLRDEESRG